MVDDLPKNIERKEMWKMKKEKGMTHITLVIWILIIIVIGYLGINFILKETERGKVENLKTDMLLVQGKIKVIEQENEMNKEENPLKGLKVSENLEDEKIKSLIENKVINAEDENFDKYYIINSETLNELKLQDNLKGEYYIVNYKTYEIIHSKGIEIEKEMHYNLTEILEHTEEK